MGNNCSIQDVSQKGIYLKGNFLLIVLPKMISNVLYKLDAEEDQIGDIWLIRDEELKQYAQNLQV